LETTLGAIASALRAELPEYGKDVAIDASDMLLSVTPVRDVCVIDLRDGRSRSGCSESVDGD
jgi:hypothetical protein